MVGAGFPRRRRRPNGLALEVFGDDGTAVEQDAGEAQLRARGGTLVRVGTVA